MLTTRTRVVLWGARRGDRQYNGILDRQLARIERDYARLFTTIGQRVLPGVSAREAQAAMRRLAHAMPTMEQARAAFLALARGSR